MRKSKFLSVRLLASPVLRAACGYADDDHGTRPARGFTPSMSVITIRTVTGREV
jgi:hypothetical protein